MGSDLPDEAIERDLGEALQICTAQEAEISRLESALAAATERAERAEGERDEARGKVAKAGAIFAAWLFDRAEQYPNDSGIRAAFDELFRPAAEGEPFKAYEAGELDDIDWLHQEKS